MLIKQFIIIALFISTVFSTHHESKDQQAYFHYYKGKCARLEGNSKTAIRQYQKAVKLDPDNKQYILALIQSLIESNAYEEVHKELNTYRQIFSTDDDLVLWYFIKGLNYACNGNHHQAFHTFKRAERLSIKHKNTDSTFMSHLFNNLACERLLFQPVEWTPSMEDKPHLTISDNTLPEAWSYFAKALVYDPTNKIALRNQSFIEQFCDCLQAQTQNTSDFTINSDQIPQSHQPNRTKPKFRSPALGLHFLPDRLAMIVRILNDYDEVVLLLDISGSMEEEIVINNKPGTRFKVMKDIATYLVTQLKPEMSIGAITVGSECDSPPTIHIEANTPNNRQKLLVLFRNLETDGSTPLNERLQASWELFSDSVNAKAILLLTDGINTCGEENTCEITENLFSQGITVFILSFLMEYDYEMEYSVYDCMANVSEGKIYEISGQSGIGNKTIQIDPPVYSLVLPQQQFDTSSCLHHSRLKCTLPCNPTIAK